MKNEIVIC